MLRWLLDKLCKRQMKKMENNIYKANLIYTGGKISCSEESSYDGRFLKFVQHRVHVQGLGRPCPEKGVAGPRLTPVIGTRPKAGIRPRFAFNRITS